MSRRETTTSREARWRRNKELRDRRKQVVIDPKLAMRQHAVQSSAAKKVAEVADVYREVMLEISDEYHDGEVQYCMLRARDKEGAEYINEEIARAILRFSEFSKEQQTGDVLDEVGAIMKNLYQGWIESCIVVPDSVRINDVPNGRMYQDGRIEAINRASDIDILDMGRRFRERVEKKR